MKRKKATKWLIILALIAILARTALYDGLTVSEYTISSHCVTEMHTFVVVSDLHSTWYGEEQEELLSLISGYSPEAIFLPGDFAQEGRPIEGSRVVIEKLSPKYPCFLTTGNHDRWSETAEDMREEYASYGATVLSDEWVDLLLGEDIFRIHGVDDPLFYDSNERFMSAVMALPVSDECVDILLSHRPEFAELYALCGFDLTVSGHAHGGQIRIPFFLKGLYAPNQGWFPSYAGGQYTLGKMHMIVSRGLMIDDLPRVFNPPEIVVITVIPMGE